ncbi:MAG: hypothetical protein JSS66_18230 [Armatimonadetes bacterium]|nr:hypothetical protein [Armatimonadota bacterium]
MKYFVLWPDGRKFGPADEHTLTQWAAESRITPETELQEEDTGRKLLASELPGLTFLEPLSDEVAQNLEEGHTDPGPTLAEPRTAFGVPEEYPMASGSPYPIGATANKGKSDLNTAWGLIVGGFALTFVIGCCCSYLTFLSLAMTGTGIYYANKAKTRGEPGAQTAVTVGIVAICLQVLLIGVAIVMFFTFGFSRMLHP